MENIKYDFLEEYNKLNPAQKQAVDTIEGAVLVVAGPGTGKTQILAARIANIIQKTDARPENILCMTYTEAGVTAMRNRLQRFIGSDAYRVNIHTFHSFCNKVIQENLDFFSYKELEPIGDIEKIELFEKLIDGFDKEHILKRWRGDIYFEIANLSKLFSLMKSENFVAADVEKEIEKHLEEVQEYKEGSKFHYHRKYKEFAKGDLKPKPFQELVDKFERTKAAAKEFNNFEKLKEEAGLYDFEDMIQWVLKAFKTNEDLLMNYQERFQYVLIDEYQDTNGSQNEILKMLISYWENPNCFVVGDDDQSIYRFQGANLGNIIDYYQSIICPAYPSVEARKKRVIVMADNYRSTQAILDTSASSIKHNTERLINQLSELELDKNLTARNPTFTVSKIQPKVIEYYNESQELLAIAHEIIRLKEAGENLNDMAVIYKNHAQTEELLHFLNQKEIPVNTARKINILEQPFTSQIINILTYINDETKFPNKREDLLFEMMHYPFFNIDTLQIARLTFELREARYEKPKTTWREALNSLDKVIDQDSIDKIKALSAQIEKWFKDIYNMPLQLFFQTLITDIKLMPYIMANEEKVWKLQELKTFFNFLKQENQKDTRLELSIFLDTIATMRKYSLSLDFVRTTFAESAVKFTTAHSSKGLEFKHVFLMGAVAKIWDNGRSNRGFVLPDGILQAPSKESELEESRRLFYVAMTRAKEYLQISYAKMNDKGKDLTGSLFASEILEDTDILLEEKSEKDDDVFEFSMSQLLIAKHENPVLIERKFLEQRLDTYSMSVTHLNNYLNCPLKFYYQNFLQIPSAKNQAMAFGSAVHNSIEELFKRMLKNENVFPSEEEFIEIVERKMYGQEDSFSKKEYQQKLEYVKKFLPEYYQRYVNEWNKDIKFEKRLYAVYEGIELNGALDKMEFDGNNVNIIDYKTGQYDKPYTKKKFKSPATSEALEKLKDKGKEPTLEDKVGGDYWRQAVYYKILMAYTKELSQAHWQYAGTAFDFVEPDAKTGDFYKQKVVLSEEDASIVKKQIVDTYNNIKAFKFNGCGEEDCEWCKFEDEYK
jgi:DNA helicase-2/ATP-dependent DNA helicase PcrA